MVDGWKFCTAWLIEWHIKLLDCPLRIFVAEHSIMEKVSKKGRSRDRKLRSSKHSRAGNRNEDDLNRNLQIDQRPWLQERGDSTAQMTYLVSRLPNPERRKLAEEGDERKNQGLAVGAELRAWLPIRAACPNKPRWSEDSELLFRQNPSFSLTVVDG